MKYSALLYIYIRFHSNDENFSLVLKMYTYKKTKQKKNYSFIYYLKFRDCVIFITKYNYRNILYKLEMCYFILFFFFGLYFKEFSHEIFDILWKDQPDGSFFWGSNAFSKNPQEHVKQSREGTPPKKINLLAK